MLSLMSGKKSSLVLVVLQRVSFLVRDRCKGVLPMNLHDEWGRALGVPSVPPVVHRFPSLPSYQLYSSSV